MMPGPQTLLGLLNSLAHTTEGRQRSLEDARSDLGLKEGDALSPLCVAYALFKLRVQPEEVSRLLSWKEFEGLAGTLFRASGFEVRENVLLTKPRAQIDLVAFGASLILSVDCKHYHREQGPAALARAAKAQLARSSLFRKRIQDPRPIASVILSVSEPEGRFVEGAAIVPIRTLRSFLNTLEAYLGVLELR